MKFTVREGVRMAMGIFGLGQALGLTFSGLLGEIIGGLFGEGAEKLIEIALDRQGNRIARRMFAEELGRFAALHGVETFLAEMNEEIKRNAVEEYLLRHGKLSESKRLKIEEKALKRHTKELIELFYDRIEGVDEDFFRQTKPFREPANEKFFAPFLTTINEARGFVLQFKFGRLEEDDKIMADMIVSSVRKIVHEELSASLCTAMSEQFGAVFSYAKGYGVGEIALSRDPLKWLPRQCPNCRCTDPASLYYNDAKREIFCAACKRTYFAVENTDGLGELLDLRTQQIVASLETQGKTVTEEVRAELKSGFAAAVTRDYLDRSLARLDDRTDELGEVVERAGKELLAGIEASESRTEEELKAEIRAAAGRTETYVQQTAALLATMEGELRTIRESYPNLREHYEKTDELVRRMCEGQSAGFAALRERLDAMSAGEGALLDADSLSEAVSKGILNKLKFEERFDRLFELGRETNSKLDGLLGLLEKDADGEKYARAKEHERRLRSAEEEVARLMAENASLKETCKTLRDEKEKRAYYSRERTLRRACDEQARELDRIRRDVERSVREEIAELEARLRTGADKYRDELFDRMRALFSAEEPARGDAEENIDDLQNVLCYLNANRARLDPAIRSMGTEELWHFMKENTARIEENSRELAEREGPQGKLAAAAAIEQFTAQLKQNLLIA